jgi:hypothetical protein
MIAKEILTEIDATLERLIRNAETLNGFSLTDLSEIELEAFQKTQESLLHHLLRFDQEYETERKSLTKINERSVAFKIQQKYQRFEKLTTSVNNKIQRSEKKLPLFSKRHKKRYIHN